MRETPYDLPSPNSWNIPSSTATNLLDQLMQDFLANLAPGQRLDSQHDFERIWMRQLCCDVGATRRLPDDGNPIVLWDGDKSAPMNELYPSRLSRAKLVDEGVGMMTDSKPIKRVPWYVKI